VAGSGGWNGSSNFVNNSATNNTVALNGGATVLTITFNGQSGSFFTAGSTAPSTDTFTPVADANDITDAANNAVSTATIAMTVTGAWDAAAPATTTIQNKGKTPSQLTMFWAPAGESDFDRYDLYYRTSSAVTYQNGALWSTSNDSALATVGTSESTVTGLLPGTAYYFIIYIIDYAGNLSPISNEYPISTSGTGGEAATDSTPPAVATDIVVSKIADGKVKITWKDPADKDLSEIYILRGDNGALVNAIPREKIVPGTQEFIDTTVKMGSTYTYVVRTLDVKGNAKDSEVFTIALAEEVAMPDEEPDTVDETGTLPDADTEGEEVIEVVDEEDTEDMDTEVEDLEDDEESDEEIQAAPLGPINDVPMGHWAEESIMAVREARLMLEKKAGEFRLEDKMTRAEAVMVIVRAIGGGSMVGELYDDAPFQDVPEDAWYAVAVHWAWKFSVIQGIEKFEPGKLVNRAEFFAMILRAQEIEIDEEKTTDHFADIPSGKWFDAVAAESFEREYLLGKPKGDLFYFAGEENITRGEAATILKKVFID
ncbi:MAG: chitinase A1, partial [Candidatus Peregrinibacteria bacterium GW2011_GWA2_47_7]